MTLKIMNRTPDGHLCPACGGLPVVNYNTHPDTRKQKFWTSDSQSITSKCCDVRLIRNGAYGAPVGQSDWKISLDCPCGVSRHRFTDVCGYRPSGTECHCDPCASCRQRLANCCTQCVFCADLEERDNDGS